MECEARVLVKEQDEALADGASAAENACDFALVNGWLWAAKRVVVCVPHFFTGNCEVIVNL